MRFWYPVSESRNTQQAAGLNRLKNTTISDANGSVL